VQPQVLLQVVEKVVLLLIEMIEESAHLVPAEHPKVKIKME